MSTVELNGNFDSNTFASVSASIGDISARSRRGKEIDVNATLNLYANTLGYYSGDLNETYLEYLTADFVKSSKEISFKMYNDYIIKDEDKREFEIPDYNF